VRYAGRFQIVAEDLYPTSFPEAGQQLVAVARALVASPKMILADEPRAICTRKRAGHHGALQEAKQRRDTIVQVPHSETNAAYSDRIIRLMDAGS